MKTLASLIAIISVYGAMAELPPTATPGDIDEAVSELTQNLKSKGCDQIIIGGNQQPEKIQIVAICLSDTTASK